jgi:succinate dehydrogenase / fumarate reductase, iron-sulfur subunit
MATADHDIKDRNNGYGHEHAITDMIEKWGTLHEAQMLPRSYGEGSMIKGQTEPGAVKQLVADLPTAIRGLKAGKVTPKKVLLHPKLPDQNQVKRIYKEIESKDERLELNMYIIGEAPEEDEGAQAEGGEES